MRIGTNIAFISHQAVWGKFLNNDNSLDNEMSITDITTVEGGPESKPSDIYYCNEIHRKNLTRGGGKGKTDKRKE